jgi:hypothetical protein
MRVREDGRHIVLRSTTGGFYWVDFNGAGVRRGAAITDTEQLQPGFVAAMERAGGRALRA